MKPEEVTQSCLAQYYLDWFNNTSREEGNKVYGFSELTAEELAILTNGTADTTVAESCSAVADITRHIIMYILLTVKVCMTGC